ncbi:MAG TPA: SgcJ/EcaC family oxidoreductase [Acidobacteriota bacterium]|nr:SgcJ/EcaC family oxidoreductase [Acidobacteriota bacterium]
MRIRMYYPALLGLAMLVATLSASGLNGQSTTSADREALAAVVQELDAAYNAQDAARFSAVFAEDSNFQFPIEGIMLRGRNEIRQHFARQFATHPPLRHVTTTGDIDVIRPGILAVDIQVDIQSIDPKTRAAQTLFHYDGLGLGIQTDSGWRIRLVRLYPGAKRPAAELKR